MGPLDLRSAGPAVGHEEGSASRTRGVQGGRVLAACFYVVNWPSTRTRIRVPGGPSPPLVHLLDRTSPAVAGEALDIQGMPIRGLV